MEEKNFKVALFSVFKRAIEEKRRSDFAGRKKATATPKEEPIVYDSIGGVFDEQKDLMDLVGKSRFKDTPPVRSTQISDVGELEKTLRIFAMSIPDRVNRLCQTGNACDKIRNSVEKESDEYGSFYMDALKEVLNGAIEYNKARMSNDWSTEASIFREYISMGGNTISPYISKILPGGNGVVLSEENAKTPTLRAFLKFTDVCDARRKSVLDSIWGGFGVTNEELKAGIIAVANALVKYIDNIDTGDSVEKLFAEFESDDFGNQSANIVDITERLVMYASENGVDVSRFPPSFENYSEKEVEAYLFLVVEKIIKKEMAPLMKCDYLKQTIKGTSDAANKISEMVSSLYHVLGNAPMVVLEELVGILNKSGKGDKPTWVQHINNDDRYGVILKAASESELKSATGGGRKKKVESEVPCPLRGHSLSIPLVAGYLNPDKLLVKEQDDEILEQVADDDIVVDEEYKLDNEVFNALFSEIIDDTVDTNEVKSRVEKKGVSILVDGWTTNDGVLGTRDIKVPGYFTGDENIINELHGVLPMYYKCLDPVVVLACIMSVILDGQCDFYRNNRKFFERLKDTFGSSIIV